MQEMNVNYAPEEASPQAQVIEKDTRSNFKDIVLIDQPITADAAIALLANYHNVDRQSIIQIFFGLHKNSLDDISQVVFRDSISGGQECINIQVYKDGEAALGGQLVNPLTGNPMARVG
ncbi:MAG: hypothetical protein WCO23_01020 [bacterium]